MVIQGKSDIPVIQGEEGPVQIRGASYLASTQEGEVMGLAIALAWAARVGARVTHILTDSEAAVRALMSLLFSPAYPKHLDTELRAALSWCHVAHAATGRGQTIYLRSEPRRDGKEGRSRWVAQRLQKQ